MIPLSFTTTSCCRNKLLSRTYRSFKENFVDVDFDNSTLFLNLDHYKGVGSIKKTVKVAESFFGNVVVNVSRDPNFAKAVKWCWSNNFPNPYVLHLEDDWELFSKVSAKDMIDVFDSHDDSLIAVRIRGIGGTKEGLNDRILLSPTLFKKDFLKIEKYMPDNKNPERRISRPKRGARKKIEEELGIKESLSYTFTNKNVKVGELAHSIVKDIGREWQSQNKVFGIYKRTIKWRV